MQPNAIDLSEFLSKALASSTKYHILAFGVQEYHNRNQRISMKRDWELRLEQSVGKEYFLLRSEALTTIHLSIFIHCKYAHHVQGIC
jgi:hypothetical protein